VRSLLVPPPFCWSSFACLPHLLPPLVLLMPLPPVQHLMESIGCGLRESPHPFRKILRSSIATTVIN
jgi:hypothetical protein